MCYGDAEDLKTRDAQGRHPRSRIRKGPIRMRERRVRLSSTLAETTSERGGGEVSCTRAKAGRRGDGGTAWLQVNFVEVAVMIIIMMMIIQVN